MARRRLPAAARNPHARRESHHQRITDRPRLRADLNKEARSWSQHSASASLERSSWSSSSSRRSCSSCAAAEIGTFSHFGQGHRTTTSLRVREEAFGSWTTSWRSRTPLAVTRRGSPRRGGGRRAMLPLWQYFSRLQKRADESIAAPKGHGPRTLRGCFPCKTPVFRGPPEGAVIAIRGPWKPTP
jgi:hypothetical protein